MSYEKFQLEARILEGVVYLVQTIRSPEQALIQTPFRKLNPTV